VAVWSPIYPFASAWASAHCPARWAARSFARLGRRATTAKRLLVIIAYDSAFRVWRILGGGKMRQTLCVLNLAKILLNYSFYFISAAAKNL